MKILLIVGAVILVLVGGIALAGYLVFRPRSEKTESIGPFDLITHTTSYLAGWNEGHFRRATTEHYSLRYKGQPFSFTGKAGMSGEDSARYETANALITFPSPEPAVVLNVGDPNNASFYYLIREVSGAATAKLLGEGSGGVSANWLDPSPDSAPRVADIALHRGRMSGGRWLLLGELTVFDVQTLTAYQLERTHYGYANQFKPPMTMSPDRRSFVRWGSGTGNAPLLVVFDFQTPTSYLVPVDRSVARFYSWEEIDNAWLHYYFEWTKGPDGHDRLTPRPNVKPLPYQGQLSIEPSDGYREYRILPAKKELQDTVIAFVEREFGGVHQPPQSGSGNVEIKVGEQTVNVSYYGDHVGVWMDRGVDSRLVAEIAARFDEELKTGRYDNLFDPALAE
jgi:hypothetical protein